MHKKHSLPLMVVSLIIGYGFWHMFGNTHTSQTWIEAPITFYNTKNKTIDAPETVKIHLSAKRADLSYLDYTQLAAHIDANTLHEGVNGIDINEDMLLLPGRVKLLHYKPANITAVVT